MAEGVHVYLDGRRAKEKVELDTLYRPFNNAGKAFLEPLGHRIGVRCVGMPAIVFKKR